MRIAGAREGGVRPPLLQIQPFIRERLAKLAPARKPEPGEADSLLQWLQGKRPDPAGFQDAFEFLLDHGKLDLLPYIQEPGRHPEFRGTLFFRDLRAAPLNDNHSPRTLSEEGYRPLGSMLEFIVHHGIACFLEIGVNDDCDLDALSTALESPQCRIQALAIALERPGVTRTTEFERLWRNLSSCDTLTKLSISCSSGLLRLPPSNPPHLALLGNNRHIRELVLSNVAGVAVNAATCGQYITSVGLQKLSVKGPADECSQWLLGAGQAGQGSLSHMLVGCNADDVSCIAEPLLRLLGSAAVPKLVLSANLIVLFGANSPLPVTAISFFDEITGEPLDDDTVAARLAELSRRDRSEDSAPDPKRQKTGHS